MYSPVELLVVDWLIPVSSLVSVTLTPGITAFEVSLTVPRIAPASTWASETASPKRLPNSTKTARVSNAEIRSVPVVLRLSRVAQDVFMNNLQASKLLQAGLPEFRFALPADIAIIHPTASVGGFFANIFITFSCRPTPAAQEEVSSASSKIRAGRRPRRWRRWRRKWGRPSLLEELNAMGRTRQWGFGGCQGKVEMSYSLQSRNVRFCGAGERVRVILTMPVKRRRAMLASNPIEEIAGRNSSWTMGRARSFRRVLGLGLGGRPTGGGTPPSGLYGFCVETTSDR